jgi:S1-C subfamily serine protease
MFPTSGRHSTFKVAVRSGNANDNDRHLTGLGTSFLLSRNLHSQHQRFRIFVTNHHVICGAINTDAKDNLFVVSGTGDIGVVKAWAAGESVDLALLFVEAGYNAQEGLEFALNSLPEVGTEVRPVSKRCNCSF